MTTILSPAVQAVTSGLESGNPPTLVRLRVILQIIEEDNDVRSDNVESSGGSIQSSAPLPRRLYTKELTRKQKQTFEESKERQIIMIDAAFDHLHQDKNIISVGNQFSYAYHHVTNATKPCFLIICGIAERLLAQLRKQGALGWRCYLTTIPLEDIIERHRKLKAGITGLPKLFEDAPEWLEDRLPQLDFVYLSADATQYLEGTPLGKESSLEGEALEWVPFTKDTVCIVGGLLDRNHYKGFCYNKAKALGIAAAKLPIDSILEVAKDVEYVGTRVMTIDQTCALIQHRVDGESWENACEKAVPQRRYKKD